VSPEKHVAVIGVGNILMGDEGLGVHALAGLEKRIDEFAARVELVDAGTALLDVIDDYVDCDALILIDAVRGGGPPGAIYRFEAEDVCGTRHAGVPTSLHEMTVLEALDMERLTGRKIPGLTVVGMEPETMTQSLEISNTVRERLPQLVETVLDELRRILDADPRAEKQE
jgi:hydrogenase maturation protease